MAKIRVLLVNQFALLGHVIAAVLEQEPELAVVGHATSAEQALDLAPLADVILVNTRMEADGALHLMRAIAVAEVPAKVLALGLADTEGQVLPYGQAGATDYVLKDDSVQDLVERIRDAHAGRGRLSPETAAAPKSHSSECARGSHQKKGHNGRVEQSTAQQRPIPSSVTEGSTRATSLSHSTASR